jgi:hypothetical protein
MSSSYPRQQRLAHVRRHWGGWFEGRSRHPPSHGGRRSSAATERVPERGRGGDRLGRLRTYAMRGIGWPHRNAEPFHPSPQPMTVSDR